MLKIRASRSKKPLGIEKKAEDGSYWPSTLKDLFDRWGSVSVDKKVTV